jgi:hypothetical protein
MKEALPLRTFDQLNVDEKVLAVLGVVYKPVSKEFSLKLGSIHYEQLDASNKAKIDAIFISAETLGLEVIKEGELVKYRLSDEKRQEIAKEVDMKSVSRQTMLQGWKTMGGDEVFGVHFDNESETTLNVF